jgi:glutathione S-transferase
MLTLVIGDRNLSSWSLRPWLAARQAGMSVHRGVRSASDQPDTGNEDPPAIRRPARCPA